MKKKDARNLKFRYLLWFYKTTKEEVDRIERKFTQLDIDRAILKHIKQKVGPKAQSKVRGYIEEFKKYVDKKEKDGKVLKYEKQGLRADYYFSTLKLGVIEKVIAEELGGDAKRQIKSLYEEEMRKRILENREHK